MLRTALCLGTVTAIALASPVSAASTPIAGPGSYPVGAVDLATEPDLAGVVLADRMQPFTITGSAGGSVSGTIEESVLRSNLTGLLHFYHKLTIDAVSGFAPGSHLEWLEFDAAATGDPLAVGRRSDGVGTPTSTIYDLAGSGTSRFDFNLIDLDAPGFESQLHLWKSNATNFTLTGKLRVQGYEFVGTSAQPLSSPWLLTYAPAVVPEPATWGLMITGFAMVGFGLRRQRAAPA